MSILNRRHAIAKIPGLALAARGTDGPRIDPPPQPSLDVPDDVRQAVRQLAEARRRVKQVMEPFDALDWDGMTRDERREAGQRQDEAVNRAVGEAIAIERTLSAALARHGALACIVDGVFLYDHTAAEAEVDHAEDNSPTMPMLDARRVLGALAHVEGLPIPAPAPVLKVIPPPPEFALSDNEKMLVQTIRILGFREAFDRLYLNDRYSHNLNDGGPSR